MIKRYKQYSPFSILQFEADEWEHPVHKHNYYEIIFIEQGTGLHTINDTTFAYNSNDVFLLSPEDYHSFRIDTHTSFCFFKFTELVFRRDSYDIDQHKWLEKIESVIKMPNQIPCAIHFKNKDRLMTELLSKVILNEHENPSCYSTEIISDSMSSLISILARNICNSYFETGIQSNNANDLVDKMLTYIRQNVYAPDKISHEAIALEFELSKNYVGMFFKKNTGETLSNYILNYKLLLAENRILNTGFSLTQIAFDLGFTDLSHLNKFFKRKFGLSPTDYKRKMRGTGQE